MAIAEHAQISGIDACVSSGKFDEFRLQIKTAIRRANKQDSLFANKAALDSLSISNTLIGRQKEIEQLVSYLIGHKKGFVVPVISIHGRSGSGKSTIIKAVCQNIGDVFCCFVNLRKAKTVFGATNLILSELGIQNIKHAKGLDFTIQKIQDAIEQFDKNTLFVLVLDEFDVLFYDKRGNPSDLVYKLVLLEENLRSKGQQITIITISNNLLYDYELDDRVLSRIGSNEILFTPYSKDEVKKILESRAQKAFFEKIDDSVIDYCGEMCSASHGDARRATDLLRVAAETAFSNNEKLSKNHIDKAIEKMQQDRIETALKTAPLHSKTVCAALARLEFLSEKNKHSTNTIFKQYCWLLPSNTKPLSYRRVSEILVELANSGIVSAETKSNGRYGYGTKYELNASPEVVGPLTFEYWGWVTDEKTAYETFLQELKIDGKPSRKDVFYESKMKFYIERQKNWKKYIGI